MAMLDNCFKVVSIGRKKISEAEDVVLYETVFRLERATSDESDSVKIGYQDLLIESGKDDYIIFESEGDDYIDDNISPDLGQAAAQIQALIKKLEDRGVSTDNAQNEVARDIKSQVKNDPIMKEKLVKWGRSLGDNTVDIAVRRVVKLALRLTGISIS